MTATITREREAVALLETHRGNISAVARALRRSRIQVHRLLERYELDPAAFRSDD